MKRAILIWLSLVLVFAWALDASAFRGGGGRGAAAEREVLEAVPGRGVPLAASIAAAEV